MLYFIGAGCLALLSVFTYYWLRERQLDRARKAASKTMPHDHPWQMRVGGANNGGQWRNRTWKPNPGFNDEFAGVIPGTCGQIRPGEWQCNCDEPKNGCLVLKGLKSGDEPAEEMTDRRGAIAAQKARKRNGS